VNTAASPSRPEPGQLTVADAVAWRAWLDIHEDVSNGVWLTLAKKGTTTPTTLTYQEALDEALCSGWIDGRKQSIDSAIYRQHFTPRRARSIWSRRNVDLVDGLTAASRMRERGQAEIERARTDGRWDRAYAGAAAMIVPNDFLSALKGTEGAEPAFFALTASARYPILLDITTASSDALRATRIARHIGRIVAQSP